VPYRGDEPLNLKEIRLHLANMVAESAIVCTKICCGFPEMELDSKVRVLVFPRDVLLATHQRPVTSVTPRKGHFQSSDALVLSVHVTGVSCTT
jgi:hypothetical protein